MKTFVIICAVVVLGMTVSAGAMTVSFTDTTGITPTDFSKQLFLPKFDSSLGTLTEVRLTLSGVLQASAGYENVNTAASSQYAKFGYHIDQSLVMSSVGMATFAMNTSGGTDGPGGTGAQVVVGPVPGFDGTKDFGGASGKTIEYTNASNSQLAVYTDTVDLAKFMGTGAVAFTYDAVGTVPEFTLSSAGLGNNNLFSSSIGIGTVSVEYIYTQVPEPLTLSLLGAGALAMLRRKK